MAPGALHLQVAIPLLESWCGKIESHTRNLASTHRFKWDSERRMRCIRSSKLCFDASE